MSNRLTSSFRATVNKGSDSSIVILVDGSGTISSNLFQELRAGLATLVPHLKKASVQIIQYAATAVVECLPTKDTNTLKKAIDDMKQLRTPKYTKLAVQMAIRNLTNINASTKIVITITDGAPKKGHEPFDVIKSAPKDIIFFAIGVGNCDPKTLHAMSTDNLSFSINDFKEFKQFAELLSQNDASIEANPIITIDFCPGPCTTTGSPVTMKLEFENISDKPTPKGMQIHFMRNSYFEYKLVVIKEAIPVGKKIKQDVKFNAQATGNDKDFPGKIEYKVTIGIITQLGMVTVPTGLLRGDFTLDKTLFKTPINVMVLGRMGSGKSALLNALITCLSMSVKPAEDVFFVAPRTGHVTTEYTRKSIGDQLFLMESSNKTKGSAKTDYVPLSFYDCWGFSPEDYKTIGFREYLRGEVKLGVTRVQMKEKSAVKSSLLNHPDRANEIHVVVMVTPIASYMEAPTMERLNEALDEASSAGYNPILVVTNIDTVDDAAELEAHKVQIMRKITIDPRNIYYHKNYFNEKIRNIEIDLSSRMILRAIWSRARQKHQEIGKKSCTSVKFHPSIVDDEDEEVEEEEVEEEVDEEEQNSDEERRPKRNVDPSKEHLDRLNKTVRTSINLTVRINENDEVLKLTSNSTYSDVMVMCIESGLLDSEFPMKDDEGNSLNPKDRVRQDVVVVPVMPKATPKKGDAAGGSSSRSSTKNTVTVFVTYQKQREKFTVKKGTLIRELRQMARDEVFDEIPEKGAVRQDGAIVGAGSEVEDKASYTV